jgi:carbonic anhydrase
MNNLPTLPKAALSRRKFLGTALAGTTATLAGAASMSLYSTKPALAQSNLTPDEALKALLDGNERSVSGRLTSFDQDLKILRDHTVDKQEPFAAVLSCADSRVPVEIIFDQTIGHIFVARVAGNVVTPEIIGSLEYGAAALGIKVILVLGHAGCGAVKAAIQGKAVPGQISSLFPHIQPPSTRLDTTCQPQLRPTQKFKLRYCRARPPCSRPWCRKRNSKS